MDIGAVYRVRPAFTIYKEAEQPRTLRGRVAWVHPKGRYCVLAFKGGIRECFFPEQLNQEKLVREGGRR